MRIQFYSLNLGRHLHQKEEALCFVLVSAPSCTCRWFWGREKVLVRMTEGLSLLIQADWELVNHHLISLVRVWCFFCLSLHLLITLCSDQRAASKWEQETRAKGAPLSFYPSAVPRFLTPLQTALASRVLSEATPVRAKLYPLHLSFYFILQKQLWEDWREELEWSGLLRPQRKEAPFHRLVVFVGLSLHGGPEHRAHRPLLPIFKYVNSKQTWIWEEDEISPPQGGIFYSCFSWLKGDIMRFGTRFGKCMYTTRMYWRLCFSSFCFSERAVLSTPSSSKHQMEPVSVSVKDEPNVWEWRVLLALGHIRPTIVAKLLTVCARIWLVAGQDPLIWSPGAGTTDWHLIKSRMDPVKTSYEWQHECKEDKRFPTEEIVVQNLDFMNWFVRPRRRENCPVTKAKLIFWKQLDGERSGRTKRRHLMSCCRSPELQFNWAPSHLQNPEGHTKRRIKKRLYIHIHWLASINGTYTDEPDAAAGAGHQSGADTSSSSLNTRQTSSRRPAFRCKHAGRAVTSWTLSSSFHGFLYTSDWMKSGGVQVMWQFEEVKDDKDRGLLSFFSFFQHASVMQFCTSHVTFKRLWADI